MKKIIPICIVLMTSVDYAATQYVNGITWTYAVANGKASIGDGASASRAVSVLTSGDVTIPDSLGGCPVASIRSCAFDNCSSLTSVTVPSSVTSIDSYAFPGCSGSLAIYVSEANPAYSSVNGMLLSKDGTVLIRGIVGDVAIPDTVTSIGANAFSGFSELSCVSIPENVAIIGDRAFAGCDGLIRVMLSDNIKSIGENAFARCSGLTMLDIPESVTRIGSLAFSGCSGLKSVAIPQYICSSKLSAVFDSYKTITNVAVRLGVTLISDSCFANCLAMQSVTIPSTVTRIGNSTFKDCSSLKSVFMEGDAPDVGNDIYNGTPRSLVTYVTDGSIGWAGGISSELPDDWNGRAIAVGNSGGGGESGSAEPPTNADARYDLSSSQKDRSIASVTVDSDCAIDEFVLTDGKVYDSVLRIVNTSSKSVKLTLPDGFEYETFKGSKPLTIPPLSRNILTITRTADKTFLVSRRQLETVE